MAAATPTLADVIDDGRWLAHRYDDSSDGVHFRFVPREQHRELTFLTDAEVGDAPVVVFSRADAIAQTKARDLPAPRLIFHSAYCCSTMLSRALDFPGTSFGLKEPQILNDVIGLRLRGGDARQVAAALDAALALLARPLAAGEVNVIKPSNVVNPLIPLFAALRPGLRTLLLYAPLEVFLNSIARKEIEGRIWVRELMWKYLRLGQVERFGLTQEDLYRQTDLQAAALGWLAQHALFADMAREQPTFRTLDSEAMLSDPTAAIGRLGALFDLPLNPREVVAGPGFTTHSKDRRAFSADQRREERGSGTNAHAREIEITVAWTRALAERAGIAWVSPSDLLD